ncbi:MAG: hypothetical protein J7M18_03070 [Candidatus Eremiobacteraeota bacterium]|nr:hypothetical protein [Candidatus Eremiobacteraeota bacterium]
MGFNIKGIASDIYNKGKSVINKGIDFISNKGKQVESATQKVGNNVKEVVRDSVDIGRQVVNDVRRDVHRTKENFVSTVDRKFHHALARTETFLETKIEIRDVDPAKDKPVENAEKKGIFDKLYAKFKEFTGKEIVVHDEDMIRRTGENGLEKIDGYKNLSEGQKNRVLDLYEKHASPETLQNLRTLAKDGRLNNKIISELEAIDDPNFKLAKGIDRDDLWNTAIKDIADPSTISQKNKGTCAATAVQIALASKNPGRYLETLRLLSSESGDASAITPGLVRTRESPITSTSDPRSVTVKVMSPAFMEYADGPNLTYKNADNAHYNDKGVKDHKGLYQSETTRLYNDVLGENSPTLTITDSNREESFNQIRDAAADGKPVPVGLHWYITKISSPNKFLNRLKNDGIIDIAQRKPGGHEVLLERIDKDPITGKEYAYIINPWGEQDRIPVEDFKKCLISATIPEKTSTINEPAKQNSLWRSVTIDIDR